MNVGEKILIIRTDIDEKESSRSITGTDNAITMELYRKYGCKADPCHLNISANHSWSKYTFIDEKLEYIGTFKTMDKLYEAQVRRYLHSEPYLGNVLILTHEQWLDKEFPGWRKVERYQ